MSCSGESGESKEKQQYDKSCFEYHNLELQFYDNEQAMFPSNTPERPNVIANRFSLSRGGSVLMKD